MTTKFGFHRRDVGLHNWRERPWSAWSFEHVSEIVPSALVQGVHAEPLQRGENAGLLEASFAWQGSSRPLAEILTDSQTDHLLVARDGKLIDEWHAPRADATRPHIVFSVTKSVTAVLLGILEETRALDTGRGIAHYLPEAATSAFGDATVRDVLDMRVSLDFREEYLNRDGDYARYRRAMLWNPREPGDRSETLADLLYSLRKGDPPHGGPFHYQSPNSDLLGLLVEHVAGISYADLLSEAIWQPLGSADGALTVDAAGNPRGAGGLCARPDDLMRLGQMILDGGAVAGRQLIPERWLADMTENGDDGAWREGNFASFMPDGRYRSQWYALGRPTRAIIAIGIHGQWLWISPERRVVIVKLSSQALPQDDVLDSANLALLSQVAQAAGHGA